MIALQPDVPKRIDISFRKITHRYFKVASLNLPVTLMNLLKGLTFGSAKEAKLSVAGAKVNSNYHKEFKYVKSGRYTHNIHNNS